MLAGIMPFHVLFQMQVRRRPASWRRRGRGDLLNIVTMPVTELEYVVAIGFFGLVKCLLAMAALTVTTIVLFGFNLGEVGWTVIPVAGILILNGWALALIVIGLILRYGQEAEILTWGLNYVVMALSGVFFTVTRYRPACERWRHCCPPPTRSPELRDRCSTASRSTSPGFVVALLSSATLIVASRLFAVHLLRVFRRGSFVTRYS